MAVLYSLQPNVACLCFVVLLSFASVVRTTSASPSTRLVYYLHTMPKTWNEASFMCRSYGAVLLTLHDFAHTNSSITYVDSHSWQNRLSNLQTDFWVGLYRNSTGSKRWQGCEDFDTTSPLPFLATTGAQPCYSSDGDFSLSPLDCNKKRPYICQRDDGQCWFQPYVDTMLADTDSSSSHVNSTTAATEGDCAKMCRSAWEQGRECWGFTFQEPTGCHLQFSEHSHQYALYKDSNHFTTVQGQGYTAYVKICTGGWVTTLTPATTDAGTTANDENCTAVTEDTWDDHVCYCECDQPPVILEAETLVMTIDEKVDKIVRELQVDPDNTSSTRRKKESAEDFRPSAQGIGYFGVAFLCCVFGGIMLMDANILFSHIISLFKRLKGADSA